MNQKGVPSWRSKWLGQEGDARRPPGRFDGTHSKPPERPFNAGSFEATSNDHFPAASGLSRSFQVFAPSQKNRTLHAGPAGRVTVASAVIST